MSEEIQNHQFKEAIGGFFYDMLKCAGITMTPGNFPERVREIGFKMATVIERAAERQAIAVIRRLQPALDKAFEGIEAELAQVKKLVDLQQEQLQILRDRLK